jgi:hypothetical protein
VASTFSRIINLELTQGGLIYFAELQVFLSVLSLKRKKQTPNKKPNIITFPTSWILLGKPITSQEKFSAHLETKAQKPFTVLSPEKFQKASSGKN